MKNILKDTVKIVHTVTHGTNHVYVYEILDGDFIGQYYFDEWGDYYRNTLDGIAACIADASKYCKKIDYPKL